MANFFPKDLNNNGDLINFDWNYVTYWGDGIPLLFWVFAYPYDMDFNKCYSANEYRWVIGNTFANKRTKFSTANTLDGSSNSFLQFPSNDTIFSNVLYNLTRGSNICPPYKDKHAVIIIDSPWARSCLNREAAPESKKNENFAVGLSLDMGNRIAKTYSNWSQWWNPTNTNCGCLGGQTLSLLPQYFKDALTQARGTSAEAASNPPILGGIQSLDILMFDPRFNSSYAPNEEQAGILLPEWPGAGGTAGIIGTQCHINKYSHPVHPFGKAFVGAFVAIYKDYTETNVARVNNLLIDVPWSGALTGVSTYKMNVKMGGTQCTLSCPNELLFSATASFGFCNSNIAGSVNNYAWSAAYPAPHTFPRLGCKAAGFGNDPLYPCDPSFFNTMPPLNNWHINTIWQSTPAGGLKISAGDGLREAGSCNGIYPTYDIGLDPDTAFYTNFEGQGGQNGANGPLIYPNVGPWQVQYSLDFNRFKIANGGCTVGESASFYPL